MEKLSGLVLKAAPGKLKAGVSMEWTNFFVEEPLLVFCALMCYNVACCLPRKQILEQRFASLWKNVLVNIIGINNCGRRTEGKVQLQGWMAVQNLAEFVQEGRYFISTCQSAFGCWLPLEEIGTIRETSSKRADSWE